MSHRASSSKSTGKKPNFMQQLFAHNRKNHHHRQKVERKRSRSRLSEEEKKPSTTPSIVSASTGVENNQNNTRDFPAVETNEQPLKDELNTKNPTSSSCEEEESSSIAAYHQRVASYLRCHHQAWHHEKEYRVLPRLQAKYDDGEARISTKPPKDDDSFASRRDSNARTTTMTSTSSTSVWTKCLPHLLLMILLHVECHDVMEASRPSYEELMAQLEAERQDRQNLALEYDKIVDRFARFKRYVDVTKEQYMRAAERHHQRAAVASKTASQSTSPSSSDLGVAAAPSLGHQSGEILTTPASISTSSRTPSHPKPANSTSGVTSLSAGSPYSAFSPQADRPASAAVEMTTPPRVANQKRNPRRVTASPARILSNLPQPSSGPTNSKVRKIDASSSPSRRPEKFPSSSSSAPLAKPKASPAVVSSYRTSVPNPFPKEAPGPSPTADPATYNDDSQTIIPPPRPAPPKMKKLPQEVPTTNKASAAKQHVETHKVGSGWISSRHAKAFVGELDNTKKPRTNSLPATFKPKGISHRLTTKKKNPPNPYENNNDEEDEDDDFLDGSSSPQEGPYVEVVRKKVDRQRLQPFQCEECGKFLDAICEADSQGVYDRHALMCHSRHRAKFVSEVPTTPEDFWELSFMDEVDAKRRQAAEAAGGDNNEDDSSKMDEKPKAKDNK